MILHELFSSGYQNIEQFCFFFLQIFDSVDLFFIQFFSIEFVNSFVISITVSEMQWKPFLTVRHHSVVLFAETRHFGANTDLYRVQRQGSP